MFSIGIRGIHGRGSSGRILCATVVQKQTCGCVPSVLADWFSGSPCVVRIWWSPKISPAEQSAELSRPLQLGASQHGAADCTTAFSSKRTKLLPFAQGCREKEHQCDLTWLFGGAQAPNCHSEHAHATAAAVLHPHELFSHIV